MNISSLTIRRFLYGEATDAGRILLTLELDYRWNMVKNGHFQRDRDLRESTKKWIAQKISIDGEGAY